MVELARGQSIMRRNGILLPSTICTEQASYGGGFLIKCETLNTGVELGQGGSTCGGSRNIIKLLKGQISFRMTISRPCGGIERRALSAFRAAMEATVSGEFRLVHNN